MKIQFLISVLGLLPGALSAQTTLFESAGGGLGDVVVLGVTEQRPPELQGIALLALECVGRTQLAELRADQTRRLTDVPGAARLLLAGEQGSLYKFRRPEPSAPGASYGLFHVDPSGRARLVLEFPGTGPVGASDPIPGRVAVTGDGRALLLATSAAASGDVWEIDLGSGVAENRTAALPPLDVERNGLALLPGWGFALAEEGAFRFERTGGAQALPLPLPTTGRWIGPDVVRSADGSTVAFLAGLDEDDAFVLACRQQGGVLQVSRRAAPIPNAGFLPEVASGPHLALSTDGSRVAWRVDGECFVREVGNSRTELHLTGPANFDNTLNDTGVIAFFDPDSLVLVVGREATGGITRSDLFRLDLLASGGSQATNLSLTSGLTLPPFDYGTVDTRDGLYEVPGAAPAWLLHHGREDRLLRAGSDGRVVEVLDRVASLDSLVVAGDHLVAGITRPRGVDDPLNETLSLVQIPPDGLGAIVVRLPGGSRLSRHVSARGHGRYAAVLEFASGGRLGRIDVPSSFGLLISPGLHDFGPTTGLSAGGDVLATAAVAGEHTAFVWSDLGAALLRTSRVESFLLPGL